MPQTSCQRSFSSFFRLDSLFQHFLVQRLHFDQLVHLTLMLAIKGIFLRVQHFFLEFKISRFDDQPFLQQFELILIVLIFEFLEITHM